MIDVLLIEDEIKLAQIIMLSLEMKEFNVRFASTAIEALDLFHKKKPDVIVSDVMMPGMDGFTLALKIREEDRTTPILFLTALTSTEDLLNGYDVGGNDYLKKPFVMEELIARIGSMANIKARNITADSTNIGKYTLNARRQILQLGDDTIDLSYRQSVLLKMLYEHRNTVLERDIIVEKLWSKKPVSPSRSLDVLICRLRKYLIKDPSIQIKNIRGIGYKMMI
ncbi:response regulator transcription factor [Sphingobacterium corticibacterium]|uniref:Response regulator transcription factor n=1 Tax=Sphingobacterium corticibacterium TaxID=2484746 RepID=A0A4Q6XYG7_9SPHI|nr:response regulator transcription factor [Sphingobacterium corticibacterium]RZF61596.1 response regulator transcription factor [Sphingobacterium corticibacterium]